MLALLTTSSACSLLFDTTSSPPGGAVDAGDQPEIDASSVEIDAGPQLACGALAELADAFDDEVIDPLLWDIAEKNGATAAELAVGALELTLASGSAIQEAYITSNEIYAAQGSAIVVETEMPVPEVESYVALQLADDDLDSSMNLELRDEGLFVATKETGFWEEHDFDAYDPVEDHWWLLSYADGMAHFSTSSDGQTWNEIAMVAVPLQNLRVDLEVAKTGSSVLGSQKFRFLSVNVLTDGRFCPQQ